MGHNLPHFLFGLKLMNYYDEWTKQGGLDNPCKICDWCSGCFSAQGVPIDWTNAQWNYRAKNHLQGTSLTPSDIYCAFSKKEPISKPPSKEGFNCFRCNFKNDYAEANQKDGSYICFNCR